MNKKCACEAIALFQDMMVAYDLWLEGDPAHEEKMKELAPAIYQHLRDQFGEPAYEGKGEPYTTSLEKMRAAIEEVRYGREKPPHAMEAVRYEIHEHNELKQMMGCDEPFRTAEDMSDTAKIIETALELLAEKDPLDAKEPLDEYFEVVTCSTGY